MHKKIVARWIADARDSGIHLRSISRATGISKSKLSDLANETGTVTVPNLLDLARFLRRDPIEALADEIGHNYASGDSAEDALHRILAAAERGAGVPNLENVSRWIMESGGYLDTSHRFFQTLVLVPPPDPTATSIEVAAVGKDSLAMSAFHTADPKIATNYAQTVPDAQKQVLKASYLDALEQPKGCVFRRTSLVGDFLIEHFTYVVKCFLKDEGLFLANASFELRRSPISTSAPAIH